MVSVRAKIEKNTLFGRAFVRIWSKIEKTPFLSGALVRIRLEIEKNTLFGRAFVRIMSKIEKNTLLVGLWLGLVQK